MAETLYFTIYPASEQTPSPEQVVSGSAWGPSVADGSAMVRDTTGEQVFPEISALSTGYYRVAFALSDGPRYSAVSESQSHLVGQVELGLVYYVSVPIARSTRITPRESIVYDPMSDGSASGRVVYEKEVFDAEVRHEMVQQAAVDAVLTHYANHRMDFHRLTYAGKTYDLGFLGQPEVEEVNGTWRNVICRMTGNKANL